jgi:hypothetical protein
LARSVARKSAQRADDGADWQSIASRSTSSVVRA